MKRLKNLSSSPLKLAVISQETLAKLIETYEFQAGKAVLTTKKDDIEQFERYTAALVRMYMGTLEDNQNITETVRTEFDALLRSKDVTIQGLQTQITGVKLQKEQATAEVKEQDEEILKLQKEIDGLNSKLSSMQSNLDDKDKLNKALTDSYDEIKDKLESVRINQDVFKATQNQLETVRAECATLRRVTDEAKKQNEALKQHETDALERCREQSQITLDKTVLELERKHQTEMQTLKEQHQAEIDKYQQKYLDLLEKINI